MVSICVMYIEVFWMVLDWVPWLIILRVVKNVYTLWLRNQSTCNHAWINLKLRKIFNQRLNQRIYIQLAFFTQLKITNENVHCHCVHKNQFYIIIIIIWIHRRMVWTWILKKWGKFLVMNWIDIILSKIDEKLI